jgi:CDP-paratose 2-epimerase
MAVAIVTGSAGLIGSETVKFLTAQGFDIVGIDNDMRQYFFGVEASTKWNLTELSESLPNFTNESTDIRDFDAIKAIFCRYRTDIKLIVHTAAQPSHDWAAREPFTDFTVNANGTLNLLEATRQVCPDAVFIFTSTNKVYGDTPNRLPLVELATRWEIDPSHPYFERGIDESISIDDCKHSLFGASKAAADIMVQEYGKYFGMKTGVFRGGCLTGPGHSGVELHGFLAYLMKCAATGKNYSIFGYKGKQVRDNIHSYDLANAFFHFYQNPRQGEVYNMGGGRYSNCSMQEAILLCEEITGNRMNIQYLDENRIGDHIWWISDVSKFQSHYPTWTHTRNIRNILQGIYDFNRERWARLPA